MGFSVSWCAVRAPQIDGLLRDLGLSRTGNFEPEDFPESEWTLAVLSNGWCVVHCNDIAERLIEPDSLQLLSAERELLVCVAEDHVMYSLAAAWSGGAATWEIEHVGENGPVGLEASGALPDCFVPVRERLSQEQEAAGGADADVDYLFDIPLEVAFELVGFRHDADCEYLSEQGFEILA